MNAVNELGFLSGPVLGEVFLRRTFPFHDLADLEFEDLVSAISAIVLGTGTIVFATGKDGGRDAAFHGTAMRFPSEQSPLSGKFILQSKHTANPAASCSDSEFNKIVQGEHPNIRDLIAAGELEHYLIFTNRKKPADGTIAKEKELIALGLKSAHIFGIEQLRQWLTLHYNIWTDLGFDRFEQPFRIQTNDITEVITAFHDTVSSDGVLRSLTDFSYVQKIKKNEINKLSSQYYAEILERSLPHFKSIEDFLKNPRNHSLKSLYEDTADEIRRKLIATPHSFETFDQALTFIIEHVTTSNPVLHGRRRYAAIVMHYMYFTCDIGQHDHAN